VSEAKQSRRLLQSWIASSRFGFAPWSSAMTIRAATSCCTREPVGVRAANAEIAPAFPPSLKIPKKVIRNR
jgi:hypothetical protein